MVPTISPPLLAKFVIFVDISASPKKLPRCGLLTIDHDLFCAFCVKVAVRDS